MQDQPEGPWGRAEDAPTGVAASAASIASHLRFHDLFLVLVAPAGLMMLVRMLFGRPALTVETVLAVLVLQSALALAAVYFIVVRGRGISWREIGFAPVPFYWLRRGVLIAILTLPLVAVVNIVTQILAGGPFHNPQLDVLAPGGFSWRGLVGMLVMAGIVAPIVEETAFRGLLYGWLRARIGIAGAIALSALIFSFVHGVLMLAPALALQGAVLAYVYERSGSLWPSVVLHGTFNMIMTVALYAALAAGVEM